MSSLPSTPLEKWNCSLFVQSGYFVSSSRWVLFGVRHHSCMFTASLLAYKSMPMHKHIISRHLFQLQNGPFVYSFNIYIYIPFGLLTHSLFFDHRIVPSVFSEQTFFSIKTVVKTWVKIQENNNATETNKKPQSLELSKLYPSIPFLKITAGII